MANPTGAPDKVVAIIAIAWGDLCGVDCTWRRVLPPSNTVTVVYEQHANCYSAPVNRGKVSLRKSPLIRQVDLIKQSGFVQMLQCLRQMGCECD